jgi:hypothetical protein
MKKLVVGVGIIAVFVIGSVVALPAGGIDGDAGLAARNDSSAALARTTNVHLKFLNDQLYPDTVVALDDWLCDGMTPCVRLSTP